TLPATSHSDFHIAPVSAATNDGIASSHSSPYAAEAQKALLYLSQREKTALEHLAIVNEFRREAPLLGRTFQAVTVLNLESGRFYQVLVDRINWQVEERAAIEQAEEEAHRLKYGKLQPALYERLQTMQEDEKVTVTIWVVAPSGKSLAEEQADIFAELAARYPEARTAVERSGKPMDVDDPALAEQIDKEYVEILNAQTTERVRPLMQALEAQGFVVLTSPGLPAATATLPKKIVGLLVVRDDVGAIALAEGGQRVLLLNSAVSSNLAPAVWVQGYDGSGVDIAVLEDDNVDFTSPAGSECPNGDNCLRAGPTRAGIGGVDWHASLVASAAASNHNTYRGMAPGARIMSAGISGPNRQHDIDALIWALDNGAEVINTSYGWCTGNTQMDTIDRAFDHYARARNRLMVVAAGNNDVRCQFDFVMSPAKGWNVLSVGAYDDHNDANWGNDTMPVWSAWINPASPNGDREKPEVVAPGVDIVGIGLDGQFVTDPNLNTGTSFSAPQVSGLAALLMHRNW
ncbi:MAG: S8 family peptidase, partial [Aggregatilineaceae bacterium]